MTVLASSIHQATGMRWKAMRHQWCSVLSAILNNTAHLTKQMVFFTVQVLLHSYPRAKSQEKDPVIIKRLWIRACCPSLCGLISREKLHRKSIPISPMLLARPPYLITPLNTRITGYLAMVMLQALKELGILHGVKTVAITSETNLSPNLYLIYL